MTIGMPRCDSTFQGTLLKLGQLQQGGYLPDEADHPQVLANLKQSVTSNILRQYALVNCVHQHFAYDEDWRAYRRFAFEKIDTKEIDQDSDWKEIATTFSETNEVEYGARKVYHMWREVVDKNAPVPEQPSRLQPPQPPLRKRSSTAAIGDAEENKRSRTYASGNGEVAKKTGGNGERAEKRDAKLTSSLASGDQFAAVALSMLSK